MNSETTRRDFLKMSVGTALGAAVLPAVALAADQDARQGKSIRLGGPAFAETSDPEELARAHRKLGYRAGYCPDIPVSDTVSIRAYRDAFARNDVVIAEVGRWVNLLDADAVKRRANMEKVIDGLALADAINARCCVDIAGSYNPSSWFGPHADNFSKKHFDASVENARKIIDSVKPARAKFCYEMMGWAHPHDVESCLRMVKAVDRKAFGVHLDPCNMVNSPQKFYNNTALLNESFDKLGRWIASCHAKDLVWEIEMNIHFREVAPGKGSIDYKTYLTRLADLPQEPPLMLEHLPNAEEYASGRDHIFSVGKEAGLQF
jgi:sugar phosphate isomerase/epimerase